MGEYEPDASRNVTGAGKQSGGEQGGQQQSGQQQQFQQDNGQMGGGSRWGTGMEDDAIGSLAGQIREHMEVIGADGVHVGTVDSIEGGRIKLTKRDSGAGFEGGSHEGHHHYLPLGLVAGVEGDRIRLSANGDVAYGLEQERSEDGPEGQ